MEEEVDFLAPSSEIYAATVANSLKIWNEETLTVISLRDLPYFDEELCL